MPILLLDDNAINVKLMQTILQNRGYKTIVTRSAEEALQQLSMRPDVQLVITDFMMPVMNGLQFLEKMLQLPLAKGLPVIMVSASSDRDTVMKARKLGCNSFLVRPIHKQQFLEKVQEYVKPQPAVLRDKAEVMQKLGLDSMEYEDLISEFSAQLTDVMSALAFEKEPSGEDVSEPLHRALTELSEGAVVLGADMYITLYAQLVAGSTRMKRSMSAILLEHLTEVQNALQCVAAGGQKMKN